MGCASSQLSKNKAKFEQLRYVTYDEVDDETYDFTEAKVLKVYDGDTFWIAAWHRDRITRFKVRLYGINCDEVRGKSRTTEEIKRADEAKKYVSDKLLNQIIRIEVLNGRVINGRRITEKYGRLLAKVYIEDVDIAHELVKIGLADKVDY